MEVNIISKTIVRGRGSYVPFTDEQKFQANSADLTELLRSQGEQLKREGREYRWLGHPGVTLRGNRWFDNYAHQGGYPVKFLQKYFNLDYVEAMSELLGGSLPLTPVEFHPRQEREQTKFSLPESGGDMRHVYAYLMKERFIGRDVIAHFAKAKALYEDARHNAVFVGFDENGAARNAHKKGTLSGVNYRVNVSGSDNRYGFGHMGTNGSLYVFEAPVDLLSFLTLYPENWKESGYIALDGVAEHAMLEALERHPDLKRVYLCLDHDPAGIEACGRLADILRGKGYTEIYRLSPEQKDWNEMLKAQHGVDAIPASEHPKIEAMRELCRSLAAEQPDSIRPYKKLFDLCGQHLMTHDPELLYPAAREAMFCARNQCEKMGKPVTTGQLATRLERSYRPHLDHGGPRAREDEMASSLVKLRNAISPAGVYTADQRKNLAETFLRLGQLCLTTKTFHDLSRQQTMEQKQKQSISM